MNILGMGYAMHGGSLLVLFMGMLFGVFMAVLGVVCMVKVIQIAEDLRYLRSKNDLSIERPKTWKNTLVVCLIVSGIIVLVLFGMVVSMSGNLFKMSMLMR